MDKKTEALKLALEALEEINKLSIGENAICLPAEIDTAMDAIHEALAEQPAQERLEELLETFKDVDQCGPLLGMGGKKIGCVNHDCDKCSGQEPDYSICPTCGGMASDPIVPPSAQQQEPVAWMDGYRNIYSLEEKAAGCAEATIALVPMANQEKTSGSPINELQCVCGAVWLGEEMVHLPDKRPPVSKPWVGLTYGEVLEQKKEDPIQFYRAIEAKLREKNA